MTKHTPSPWSITGNFEFIKGGRDGQSVCYMNGMPYPSEKPGEQMRANARLITAAPDLLAACQKLCGAFDRGWDLEQVCEEISAAISKALGETNND